MAKDNWTSEAYSNAASFVPQLTTKVLQWLDPQPTDHVLDIGCGDGILSDKIAAVCETLVGLDSSSSMIQTANEAVKPKYSNVKFFVADCRRVSVNFPPNEGANIAEVLKENQYDKVFSNAAMHWILRDETTRVPFFSDIYRLLKHKGTFTFEMGGFENVAEVHTALYAVLRIKYGLSFEDIRAVDPWFYPSKEWMRPVLEEAGFAVEKLEMEHRPTKLTAKQGDETGGTEAWVRLMGANYFQVLAERDRDDAVRAVCEVLRPAMTKIEDGSQWLNYVRLRAVARKP